MTITELKDALRQKNLEYEVALQAGVPHAHLSKIYKGLKNLQYQKVQTEIKRQEAA